MTITTGTIRCGIYLRISLDKAGQALGVGRQRTATRAKASSLGWTVIKEYVDNDTSASKASVRRPGYEQLLADIDAGELDAVVVLDVDRLIRRPIELEQFMELTDRKKVALANISGDIDLSTAQGQLMARIKGALAAQEVRRLGERVAAEALQRAERGLPPKRGRYGRAYGYTPDWEVHPVEGPIVAEMYSRIIDQGESIGSVLTWMRDSNHLTVTGKQFSRAGLTQVLDNPTYAGLRRFHGEIMLDSQASWPAIIDRETYHSWVALREANGGSTDNHNRGELIRRFLLTNIAVCGYCTKGLQGSAMGRKRRDGQRANKLHCPAAGGGCNKILRNYDEVEALVLAAFFAEVERDNPTAAPAVVDGSEKAIVECEAAIEEYRTAHEAGHLSLSDYLRFAKPHTERLSELRKGAVAAKAKARPKPDGVRVAFERADLSVKRAMLRERIAAVVVKPQVRRGPNFDPSLIEIVWREQ